MKKALVLSLFVMLGVGIACSAQLQGEWDTWLKLNIHPTFGLGSFYSFLDVQYLVGGWTLEAATVINDAGLSNLWFEAYGSLGAFSMWSLAAFDPVTPAFTTFENGAEVSIAGVDLYALFAIQNFVPGYGSGFAVGGIGTAGDIRIGAEITWNLSPNLWGIFLYGLNGWVTDWTYLTCSAVGSDDLWNPVWSVGGLSVIQSNCAVVFSYITAVAQFPICCADVYVMARFSCTGFDCLGFLAKNVDIGLDWLKLYQLGVTYTLTDKDIGLFFQVVTGDVVCFKPYFSVQFDEASAAIQGITLNALTLTCTVGGCEFYWGHIFNNLMNKVSGSYWESGPCGTTQPGFANFYFIPLGLGLTRYGLGAAGDCYWYVMASGTKYMPNEVFGVQCDEDSCCGGLFSFGVNNFFNTTDSVATGIFGWMGTYAELTVGVGSNISLIGAMNVTAANGVEYIILGVNVAW
ncbi:MAG: hypothetical protein ABFD77_01705 [Thermotogota bacterium]